MTTPTDLRPVAEMFLLHGDFLEAVPYGSGHINDTYAAVFDQGGTRVRYIFQRINHRVFQNPVALMDNIQRVTAHLQTKLPREKSRRALTLIPARDGRPFHRDAAGHYWRCYLFIEGARTYDAVQSPRQAYEAARAFGRFQELLADLPPPRLHETIPTSITPPNGWPRSKPPSPPTWPVACATADPKSSLSCSGALTCALLDAGLPERITHNDTKLNNVMLDDATGEGVCVIDLDTVMPGLALYDFGDQVRTTTSPAKEDERDLSKVGLRREMFEALARGYLETAPISDPRGEAAAGGRGKVITLEIGIRPLTDFLAGDVYFKVHRPDIISTAAAPMFQLVASIETQERALTDWVQSLVGT